SPAAEAFRYFMLEQAEGYLAARFGPLWPGLSAHESVNP
ncbi:MAG: hypothetical protein RJB14_1031, partial [Pseudomonadota bacterium]